jgi:hypothetical protein
VVTTAEVFPIQNDERKEKEKQFDSWLKIW